MANYADLKKAISDVIKTNGAQQITGQVMQNSLLSLINSIGKNSQFAGIATPKTNPGTPDQNIFYIATEAGTYVNFGAIEILPGEAVILEWSGKWEKKVSGFATEKEVSKLGGYQMKIGIKGAIDFTYNNTNLKMENACTIIETMLVDDTYKPSAQLSLCIILGRSLDYFTNGEISSRLNTGGNNPAHKNKNKLSVIVANREKVYNEYYDILWSELTKTYNVQGQFVSLNNYGISYKGNENVILGDIIVLGRKLEPYEIPIAFKNPRAFLNDAVIFFPKEKYTESFAIEVCSNTKVNFKSNGIIV